MAAVIFESFGIGEGAIWTTQYIGVFEDSVSYFAYIN